MCNNSNAFKIIVCSLIVIVVLFKLNTEYTVETIKEVCLAPEIPLPVNVSETESKISYAIETPQIEVENKNTAFSFTIEDFDDCGWQEGEISGEPKILKKLSVGWDCKSVFDRWIAINDQNPPDIPPREIPAELRSRYTMNDTANIGDWYLKDNKVDPNSIELSNWTQTKIDEILTRMEKGEWRGGYTTDTVANSMNSYRPVGVGLVVGSLTPWLEVGALFFGAKSVITATYNDVTSADPRISGLHPRAMAQNYSKYLNFFDWAASYSSIEHSGLGRYGDVLDPEGDILEMQKVRCWLKDGGLFYFGVPTFPNDTVIWNSNRVYGPRRLPYMFAGFEIVAIIHENAKKDGLQKINLRQVLFELNPAYGHSQHTFVLRKIAAKGCV